MTAPVTYPRYVTEVIGLRGQEVANIGYKTSPGRTLFITHNMRRVDAAKLVRLLNEGEIAKETVARSKTRIIALENALESAIDQIETEAQSLDRHGQPAAAGQVRDNITELRKIWAS